MYIEPDHWPQLAGWKHLVLFRMVQEILTNVLKHSQANLVQVEVSLTGSFLNIQLKDNGIGYDPTQKPEKPHLGIRHLHDRARSINAQLQAGVGHIAGLLGDQGVVAQLDTGTAPSVPVFAQDEAEAPTRKAEAPRVNAMPTNRMPVRRGSFNYEE